MYLSMFPGLVLCFDCFGAEVGKGYFVVCSCEGTRDGNWVSDRC